MQNRIGFKTLVLTQSLLLASSLSLAAPNPSELDAQAREALRAGQYRQVITLTRELTQTDPLSALNWYRMAIAAEKERDYTLASRALQTAEKLDPSLAFASSAERVQALKALIAAGGASQAPAGATNSDAPAGASATAMPAAPRELAVSPPPTPIAGAAPATTPIQAVNQSGPQPPAWYFMFISVAIILLATLGVMIQALIRATRRHIHARKVDVATMPLDDLIAQCRDNLALLQQRLDYHGHKDTELAALLSRLQPAFARECGRSRLSLEYLKADRPLADVKQELAARVPVLGSSSAEQVHKDAVQLALQKQRRA